MKTKIIELLKNRKSGKINHIEILADEITRLDPYTYTMEGLRKKLVQRINKSLS